MLSTYWVEGTREVLGETAVVWVKKILAFLSRTFSFLKKMKHYLLS